MAFPVRKAAIVGVYTSKQARGLDRSIWSLEPRSLIVLGNIVDVPHEDLLIGKKMKIRFEDIPGEDITIWRFTAR
jgi:hypothetical protein